MSTVFLQYVFSNELANCIFFQRSIAQESRVEEGLVSHSIIDVTNIFMNSMKVERHTFLQTGQVLSEVVLHIFSNDDTVLTDSGIALNDDDLGVEFSFVIFDCKLF